MRWAVIALGVVVLVVMLTLAAVTSVTGMLSGGAGTLAPTAQALAGIPPAYLALYQQAAQRCAGLPWTVLAAIGEVESDHGRSTAPGVHSGSNFAGAAGPMQLGIGTGPAGDGFWWFAVDGNADGCSGLTHAAYQGAGVQLPRTAQAQYDAGPHLPADATPAPGDLVFFGTSPTGVTHVGIVLAPGRMIDAPTPAPPSASSPIPPARATWARPGPPDERDRRNAAAELPAKRPRATGSAREPTIVSRMGD